MFVSKKRSAVNEMGSLKEVFNGFNTLVGMLESPEFQFHSCFYSFLVVGSKKNESWFGC